MVKLLRMPGVLNAVGISKSSLYRLLAAGEFPAGVRIGERSVAWSAAEIEGWIAARIRERDSRAAEGGRK